MISVPHGIYSHPLDAVLVPLLDEADALEDVGDVVDAPLLLHLQHVRRHLQVQQALLSLLQKHVGEHRHSLNYTIHWIKSHFLRI